MGVSRNRHCASWAADHARLYSGFGDSEDGRTDRPDGCERRRPRRERDKTVATSPMTQQGQFFTGLLLVSCFVRLHRDIMERSTPLNIFLQTLWSEKFHHQTSGTHVNVSTHPIRTFHVFWKGHVRFTGPVNALNRWTK